MGVQGSETDDEAELSEGVCACVCVCVRVCVGGWVGGCVCACVHETEDVKRVGYE